MRIREVEAENFMSHEKFDLDMSDQGLVCVSGDNRDSNGMSSNGSGKSALFEALPWTVWGETIRDLDYVDSVINEHGDGGAYGRVELMVNGEVVEIERFRDHDEHGSGLRLTTPNEVFDGDVRTVQERIDEVVPITYQLFTTMVYFGQGGIRRFSRVTDSERKKTFRRILSLGRFDEYRAEAKDRRDEVREDIDDVEQELDHKRRVLDSLRDEIADEEEEIEDIKETVDEHKDLLEGRIEDLSEEVEELKSVIETKEEQLDEVDGEIEEVNGEIESVEDEIEEVKEGTRSERENRSELQDDIADLKERKSEAESDRSKAESKLSQVRTNISSIEGDVEEINDRKIPELLEKKQSYDDAQCPECGQGLPEDQRREKKESVQDDIDDLKAEAERLEEKLESQRDKASELEDLIETKEQKAEDLESDIEEKEEALDLLRSDLEEFEAKIEDLRDRKEDMVQRRSELKDERSDLRSEISEAKGSIETKKEKVQSQRDKIERLEEKVQDKEDELEEMRERSEDLEEEVENYEEELADLESQEAVWSFWYEGFSKDEIQSMLLDSVTPTLNDRAMTYSEVLTDGTYQISFATRREKKSGDGWVDDFSINVSTDDGETREFNSFSGGEKQRLDICIMMALHDLALSVGDQAVNTMFYDEFFSRVDSVGTERLAELIRSQKSRKDTVMVITHNEELARSSIWDKRLKVIKEGGVSRVNRVES